MILDYVPAVVANDLDDWERILRRFAEMAERGERRGFSIPL